MAWLNTYNYAFPANSFFPLLILPVFILLAIWSLVWKGLALWKAGRAGSKGWFVALLIINTLGILEILYLYVFSKKAESSTESHSR